MQILTLITKIVQKKGYGIERQRMREREEREEVKRVEGRQNRKRKYD